jgi:acetyl-CoA acetyltransferase
VSAERQPIWLAAGLRTAFARVDGPLAGRDALALSVPVVQAMARQATGSVDLAVWGSVMPSLAYSNLAREIWLEARLDPHVPTFTTILQCCTSMVAAFEAAGIHPQGLTSGRGIRADSTCAAKASWISHRPTAS